jgi:hypothetical protein
MRGESLMTKKDESFDRETSPKAPDATGAEVGLNQATTFPIGVMQFDCGDCCKEAVGYGFTQFIVGTEEIDFRADDLIITRAYQNGKLIETQISHIVITIPRDRFCYVARPIRNLNPCTPLNIGVSPLSIELDCGACCTKFLNIGTIDFLAPGFLIISPPEEQSIYIKTFSNGKLISVRATDSSINIAENRICSREQNVLEIEPQLQCCRPSVPCSSFCVCNHRHR